MEFWITVVGLLRRKRVLIPAVLVALALGAVVYFATPVTYVSSTTMVLTTTQYGGTESQDPANPTGASNPLLNFNDSLETASAILIQTMSTKDVATQLGARGPTQLFVNDGRTNPDLLGLNGPFLFITARSQTPDEAKRVVEDAQALTRQKLLEWQSVLRAPQKTYVSLLDVVPPSAPEPDRGRGTKFGVMALLLGFVLSIGVAYFGQQVGARRRARAASTPVDPTPVDPTPVDTTPPRGRPDRDRAGSPARLPAVVTERDDEDFEPAVVPTPAMRAEPGVGINMKAAPGLVGPSVYTNVRLPRR